MRKVFTGLVLLLCVCGMANAQMLLSSSLNGDCFSIIRMYRDRSIQFSSPRLDSLQMNVAIDDDANAFTLDSWADNRAGLVETPASKLSVHSFLGFDSADDNSTTKTRSFGFAGQRDNVEVEGLLAGDGTTYDDATQGKDHFWAFGVGYGKQVGDIMLGGHSNFSAVRSFSVNASDNNEAYSITKNHSTGIGAAYKTDFNDITVRIGTTLDYVSRGQYSWDNTNADLDMPLTGFNYGAHTIVDLSPSLRFGLRASLAPINGDASSTASPVTSNVSYTDKEFGARLLWKSQDQPLTVGFEYASLDVVASTGTDGQPNESKNSGLRLGGSLRILDNRMLLGSEYVHTLQSSDSTSDTATNSYTVGAEYYLSGRWTLRSSLRCQLMDASNASQLIFATGAGYKGDKYNLDLAAWNNHTSTDDTTDNYLVAKASISIPLANLGIH